MLKTLFAPLQEFKRAAGLAALFAALEVVMEVLLPLVMALLIDQGISSGQMPLVVRYGVLMLVAAFLSLAFGVLSSRFAARASAGYACNLRESIFAKVQTFSFSNIDKFSTAGLVTRMTTDVTNLQNAFLMILRIGIRSPLMLLASLVLCLLISPRLSLVFLVAMVVLAVALGAVMAVTLPLFQKVFDRYDDLNASVQENVSAIRVVKAFVRGGYESKRFDKTTDDLRQAQLGAGRLFTLSGPITMGIMWTCSVLILFFGGREIIFQTTGLLTGQLVSLVNYAGMAVNSLSMISWLVMSLSRAQASLVRINEVLDEKIDITDGPSDAAVESGSIDFEDVCFSYTRDPDKLALRHVTLHIASGETIGVIGGTGEGKSTLVSLIPRFYDALSGTVKVDGRDVREYTLENLRSGVSMVLQNGSLFSGAIADNLRWADPNATLAQMQAACAIARADEYIDRFPNGYDTVLEQNAANLSGGQRQRLLIARAILKRPKILILDDSTSAVDMATDEHIRRCLRTALPGATKVIIAQRINSIMSCDRIVVLDRGRLADMGTHQELLSRSHIYRDVYESQMREGAVDHAAS